MTHDPLCPTIETGFDTRCQCDLIDKVREDEQDRQYEFQSDNWEKGYFYAIAKCIAAVEATRADAKWPQDVDDAIAALRALQEKP